MSMRIVLHKGNPIRLNSSLAERLRKVIVRKGGPDASEEQKLVNALFPLVHSKDPTFSYEAIFNLMRGCMRFVGDSDDRLANLNRIADTLKAEVLLPLGPEALRSYLIRIFEALGMDLPADGDLRSCTLAHPFSTIIRGAEVNREILAMLQTACKIPTALWEMLRVGLHLSGAAAGLDPKRLRAHGDQLWERIRIGRRYGLKVCQFKAESVIGENEHLAVVAGEDASPGMRQAVGDPVFAFLLLSTHYKDVDSIMVDPLAIIEAINDLADGVKQRAAERGNMVDRCFWTVRNKGHLALMDTRIRGDRVMEAYGCADSYPLLRLMLLTRLHDLVVPAEVADALPGLDDSEKELVSTGTLDGREQVLQAMLMPRLQLSGSVYTRGEGFSGTFRRHGVVWHIRRLPKGYRPSLQARELAKEFGITLGAHETFVRAHERGEGEEPPPAREVKFDR